MDSKMSAPVLTDLLSKQLWEGYLLFAIKVIKLKIMLQGLRWGITPFSVTVMFCFKIKRGYHKTTRISFVESSKL